MIGVNNTDVEIASIGTVPTAIIPAESQEVIVGCGLTTAATVEFQSCSTLLGLQEDLGRTFFERRIAVSYGRGQPDNLAVRRGDDNIGFSNGTAASAHCHNKCKCDEEGNDLDGTMFHKNLLVDGYT